MWSLAGSQAVVLLWSWVARSRPIQLLWGWVWWAGGAAFGLSHAALGSPVFGLWVEQLASAPDAHPPEVSGVGPQSARLRARDRASGECRGCLSCVHSPGAEGGGAPEAEAAAESSLTSP